MGHFPPAPVGTPSRSGGWAAAVPAGTESAGGEPPDTVPEAGPVTVAPPDAGSAEAPPVGMAPGLAAWTAPVPGTAGEVAMVVDPPGTPEVEEILGGLPQPPPELPEEPPK